VTGQVRQGHKNQEASVKPSKPRHCWCQKNRIYTKMEDPFESRSKRNGWRFLLLWWKNII